MKNVKTVARVHTHTQGGLINDEISMKNVLLNVYITDQLLI